MDAALVRAVALPSDLALPPLPEVSGIVDVDAQLWRRWIIQVWQHSEIADAIEVASPSLADRVRAVCTGDTRTPKHLCRIGSSLARYVRRGQHRATPFGLFAGVAAARVGPELAWRWGEQHHPVAQIDAVWLADVITHLETCPELQRRLLVMADPTCFVRGDRLVVPCQQPPHDSTRAPTEVSVRSTPAVQTVIAAAASPLAATGLIERLTSDYPATPVTTIETLLGELVAHRVLLTGLRPPMTVVDPLRHLIDQLSAVGAESLPTVAPTLDNLRAVQARLDMHNEPGTKPRRTLRSATADQMQGQNTTTDQPLVVNTHLDAALTLPQQVAREAERAADVLARLTPYPSGLPAWRDYHARFLERYGPDALVPIRLLTDPDTGLDFPAGYRGSLLPQPESALSDRDKRLVALAQRAALEGNREIMLTDALVAELAHDDREPQQPPHIDLCFQIQAPTRSAVQQGDFTLAVAGLSPSAGATAGRFLPLLPVADRDRMSTAYAQLPTMDEGAVRAQMSSSPLQVRTENVSRAPAVWPVISIAEHRADETLPVDDLAVGADAERLYLVRLSTGQRVEPAAMNAVELTNFSHPLARMLCELPRARAAAIGPFAWGAAKHMPFLPRVRYGRTVLAPATWTLTSTDLAGTDAGLDHWHESLMRWQKHVTAPNMVQLGDGDQRLHLDLRHCADAQLLRSDLDRVGNVRLSDAPDEARDYGWCDGRAHEIALSLAATRHEQPRPPRARTSAVIDRQHGHLPADSDSAWLSVTLYAHPDRHTEILTRHVSELLASFDQPPQWWFVRYTDPQPHLRLRLRVPGRSAFGHVATRVGTWANDLRQRGLTSRIVWDTYYPEIGRYGTGTTMSAAESVFAADSAACLPQLALTGTGAASAQAVTTASFVDIATAFLGDIDLGMRWLIEHINTANAPHPSRDLHREATQLATPRDDHAPVRHLPGGDEITAAWTARRDALTAYRTHLGADNELRPETVLGSLLHMHHLRTAGLDVDDERTCYRLARSAALSWQARHDKARR